ncbi:MAG: hypothetical protein D6679_14190, partial [Candidatus Hydrogenedentota bacterium]
MGESGEEKGRGKGRGRVIGGRGFKKIGRGRGLPAIFLAGLVLFGCGAGMTQKAGKERPQEASLPGAERPGAVWDDGLAEVASYEGTWRIYGIDNPLREATLITVKERFDLGNHVKYEGQETGGERADILKQNIVLLVPTPNYMYRILGSLFVFRSDPWKL